MSTSSLHTHVCISTLSHTHKYTHERAHTHTPQRDAAVIITCAELCVFKQSMVKTVDPIVKLYKCLPLKRKKTGLRNHSRTDFTII